MRHNKTEYGEPIVYNAESRNFFLCHLQGMVEKLLDFKESSPVKLDGSGKFNVDVNAVMRSSQIHKSGEKLSDVIQDFSENILDQSLNFGSPAFLAHPDNGSGVAAMLGDFARGMMQQNLVSYEYSPAATYVEYALLQQIRAIVGYKINNPTEFSVSQKKSGFFDNYIFGQSDSHHKNNNENQGDFSVGLSGGAFLFGGTHANFIGLLAAREKIRHKLIKNGQVYDPRKMKILTKIPYAHYSMRRSAFLLGLGNSDLTDEQIRDMGLSRDMRVNIESENYKMSTYDLEVKINSVLDAGEKVMSIFAIAGDSRMVSFDDLREITKIAEKYDIWVHADGCEGGQCLFSPRRRHLWDGVENVNSISLDPHKVLMVPYNLSIFMLRDIEDMGLIDIGTSLVRLGSLSHGTYTPGIGSKDFASLRLWFLLKHLGWDRLAEVIDHRHELAKETAKIIEEIPELLLINKNIDHNAVAFVFCPHYYLNSVAFNLDTINAVNKQIHHRLNCQSEYYLHMMRSQDDNFILSETKKEITILRIMYGNPNTTVEIVKNCLNEVVKIGYGIFEERKINAK